MTPHINAVLQHENTHYRHKKGRSSKYLEKPLNANKGKVGQIVAAAIKGQL